MHSTLKNMNFVKIILFIIYKFYICILCICMYVINLNIYIYRRANGTYISQKIAICSFWTVCPCFNPTPTAGWGQSCIIFPISPNSIVRNVWKCVRMFLFHYSTKYGNKNSAFQNIEPSSPQKMLTLKPPGRSRVKYRWIYYLKNNDECEFGHDDEEISFTECKPWTFLSHCLHIKFYQLPKQKYNFRLYR